jgi:hypothetical protein
MASVDEEAAAPRGVGATSACVVERLRTIEEIIDWRPFDSFARRVRHPDLGRLTAVVRLTMMGGGTHLEVTWFAGGRGEHRDTADPDTAAFIADQSDALDRLVALAAGEERYETGAPSPTPASATR